MAESNKNTVEGIMTPLANGVRTLSGTSDKVGIAGMTEHVNQANDEIDTQVTMVNEIVETLNNKVGYVLPVATEERLGGVRSGNEVQINEYGKMQLSTVGIDKGGTGATNAEAARENLGLSVAAEACVGYDSKKGTLEERFTNVLYVFDFDEDTGELRTYSGDYTPVFFLNEYGVLNFKYGQTWEQWINTDYNTVGLFIENDKPTLPGEPGRLLYTSGTQPTIAVHKQDLIQDVGQYRGAY